MKLKGKVIINKQEQEGNYDFSIPQKYMTAGFQHTFGSEAATVAFAAVSLIMKTYPGKADYLQTFKYIWPDGSKTNFWIIHDYDHYTVLLPEEY